MAMSDKRAGWTPWRRMRLRAPMDERILAEVLDGGQSFRWTLAEGIWTGMAGRRPFRIRPHAEGVEWSQPAGTSGAEEALALYLDAEGSQVALADSLPWRSDRALREAMEGFPGLRILRQDPDEALLAFLCSSNKRIAQIRRMVAALADSLGEEAAPGHRALPSWGTLAAAEPARLRACGLGYRAEFIRATARRLADRPGWHRELEALSTAEAEGRLAELPGVGPKVASCVALFGLGRMDAFPVDTWISRILSEAYGLGSWKPAALAQFGRAHFGAGAGLAQQHLFAWARAGDAAGRVAG